jgi:hypothetical protein
MGICWRYSLFMIKDRLLDAYRIGRSETNEPNYFSTSKVARSVPTTMLPVNPPAVAAST